MRREKAEEVRREKAEEVRRVKATWYCASSGLREMSLAHSAGSLPNSLGKTKPTVASIACRPCISSASRTCAAPGGRRRCALPAEGNRRAASLRAARRGQTAERPTWAAPREDACPQTHPHGSSSTAAVQASNRGWMGKHAGWARRLAPAAGLGLGGRGPHIAEIAAELDDRGRDAERIETDIANHRAVQRRRLLQEGNGR